MKKLAVDKTKITKFIKSMKTENQLNKSKAAKRRLRNKRRRKEQQQQRQEATLAAAAYTPTQSSTTSLRKTPSEQIKCPQIPSKETLRQPKTSREQTAVSDLLWQQTYENSTRWLCMQQMSVLRQRVELLQQENEVLRVQLERAQANGYAEILEEYITSPSASEAEDEPVDEGYLEFMAVTQRHREELRKARELEAAMEPQYNCEA